MTGPTHPPAGPSTPPPPPGPKLPAADTKPGGQPDGTPIPPPPPPPRPSATQPTPPPNDPGLPSPNPDPRTPFVAVLVVPLALALLAGCHINRARKPDPTPPHAAVHVIGGVR